MRPNDQKADQRKQKIEDNLLIIGHKDIDVYIAAVAKKFCNHNYIFLQVPRTNIEKAKLIMNYFGWCSNEDSKRKIVKVNKGDGRKFEAIKIRLDLLSSNIYEKERKDI